MKLTKFIRNVIYIIGGVMVITILVSIVSCYSDVTHASASDDVATVYDTPADGPLYDLPKRYNQTIVCERNGNRAYVLIENGKSFALIPYLDADGNQVVVDRP